MNLTQDLNHKFYIENNTYHILMITHGVIERTVPAHEHSINSYEVHYIYEGRGKLITNNVVYPLTPGTLFITGPGILHQQEPDPLNPMGEDCLYFYIEDSFNSGIKSPITEVFRTNPFWYGEDRQKISDILKTIHEELFSQSIGHSITLNASFQRYLVALARNIAPFSLDESISSHAFHLEIESAFLYRYRELTLDDICEIVGLCRRQTQRFLLKYYGCTFQKKRTAARMSAAGAFLKHGNYNIEQIASLTGYSSLSSFLQAFKSYYHLTVREYRELHLSPAKRQI